MKFFTILIGVLTTFTIAAPTITPTIITPTTTEKRNMINTRQLNNLAFNSVDIRYLNVINALDVSILQQLALNNNLNAAAFQSLFSSNALSVNAILQLQQLQTLVRLAQLGALNNVNLFNLNLQALQLGLINNVGNFNLASLIDPALTPQITLIAGQSLAANVTAVKH